MTPQEKAEDLFNHMSYFHIIDNCINHYASKQCTLIAVDELIEQESKYNNGSFYPSNYWSEVKAEIEKL
jgi:surface antigen